MALLGLVYWQHTGARAVPGLIENLQSEDRQAQHALHEAVVLHRDPGLRRENGRRMRSSSGGSPLSDHEPKASEVCAEVIRTNMQ